MLTALFVLGSKDTALPPAVHPVNRVSLLIPATPREYRAGPLAARGSSPRIHCATGHRGPPLPVICSLAAQNNATDFE